MMEWQASSKSSGLKPKAFQQTTLSTALRILNGENTSKQIFQFKKTNQSEIEILARSLQILHQHTELKLSIPVSNDSLSGKFSPTSEGINGVEALIRVANSEGNHKIGYIAKSILDSGKDKTLKERNLTEEQSLEIRECGQLCSVPKMLQYESVKSSDFNGRKMSQQSVAITGGLGGLGLLTARFLYENNAERILLLGRSGRGEIRQSMLENSTEICLIKCDVASKEDSFYLSNLHGRNKKLDSIIHAGGVLRDGLLRSQSAETLRTVLAPKVNGLQNLSSNFANFPASISAFSSIAGILGSSGQGNYAVANSIMDDIIHTLGCKVIFDIIFMPLIFFQN